MCLYNMKTNCRGVIINTPSNTLLEALGVRKGKCFLCKVKQPFGGPMIIQIDDRKVAIDKSIAENIIIQELEEIKEAI
ncbi:FeoA family protein [Anaerobranca gottschalkii]|uniref:Ferrous iron transport protein A n=1 Tax=Anaerobranca gottschalkii DSM 13577 TaxID=1120990 RepID=A0A1H9YVA3_9FIRM|nr:FeoA family protein [Anaerobranca gottschalkii]SES72487.1 ferrous iron transport protein A [Anaerobranca gottschalkii DSM 13577]